MPTSYFTPAHHFVLGGINVQNIRSDGMVRPQLPRGTSNGSDSRSPSQHSKHQSYQASPPSPPPQPPHHGNPPPWASSPGPMPGWQNAQSGYYEQSTTNINPYQSGDEYYNNHDHSMHNHSNNHFGDTYTHSTTNTGGGNNIGSISNVNFGANFGNITQEVNQGYHGPSQHVSNYHDYAPSGYYEAPEAQWTQHHSHVQYDVNGGSAPISDGSEYHEDQSRFEEVETMQTYWGASGQEPFRLPTSTAAPRQPSMPAMGEAPPPTRMQPPPPTPTTTTYVPSPTSPLAAREDRQPENQTSRRSSIKQAQRTRPSTEKAASAQRVQPSRTLVAERTPSRPPKIVITRGTPAQTDTDSDIEEAKRVASASEKRQKEPKASVDKPQKLVDRFVNAKTAPNAYTETENDSDSDSDADLMRDLDRLTAKRRPMQKPAPHAVPSSTSAVMHASTASPTETHSRAASTPPVRASSSGLTPSDKAGIPQAGLVLDSSPATTLTTVSAASGSSATSQAASSSQVFDLEVLPAAKKKSAFEKLKAFSSKGKRSKAHKNEGGVVGADDYWD